MTDKELFLSLHRFCKDKHAVDDFSCNNKLILSETKEEVFYQSNVFNSYGEPSNCVAPIAKGIVRQQIFASNRDVSPGMYVRDDNFIVDSCKPNDVKAIIIDVNPYYALAICPDRFFGEFSGVKRSIESYSWRGVRAGEAFLPSFSDFQAMKQFDCTPIEAILQKDFGTSLFSYEINSRKTFSNTCNKYWVSDDDYLGAQIDSEHRLAIIADENNKDLYWKSVRLEQREVGLGFPFLCFRFGSAPHEARDIHCF